MSGSGNSTPTRSRARNGNVRTPAGQFQPPDVSTPIDSGRPSSLAAGRIGATNCPQTPVEIRRFLGTNNSGAGRLVIFRVVILMEIRT